MSRRSHSSAIVASIWLPSCSSRGGSDARGIQEIRDAGQCRRSRHRRDHRRGLRWHRQFAGRGRLDAGHRCRHRRSRFLQLFHPAVVEGHRGFAGRGQEARRRAGLGKLPHRRDQLHHHRVGAVPGRQADESDDAGRGGEGIAADQAGAAAHGNPRPVESGTDSEALGQEWPPNRQQPSRRRRQSQGAVQLRDRRDLRGRHRAHRTR